MPSGAGQKGGVAKQKSNRGYHILDSTSKISRLLCFFQYKVQRYLILLNCTGDVKPSVHKNEPAKLLGEKGKCATTSLNPF